MISNILSGFGLSTVSVNLEVCARDRHESDKHDSPFVYLSSNPDEVLDLPRELEVLELNSDYTGEKYHPSLEKLYEQISQLPNLHTLDVYGCLNFSDKEFKYLSGLKNLKVLNVFRCNVEGSGLSFLPDSIEKLNVRVMPEYLHLLKRFSRLELFQPCGRALQPECMKLIAQCTQLKELIIDGHGRGMFTDESAEHLPAFKQLESLTIYHSTNFFHEGLEHVAKIDSLKNLVLNMLPIGKKGISHLSSCLNLESLKIISCGDYEDESINDESIGSLSVLPSLKKLEISNLDFTSNIFSVLSEFPALKDVTIEAYFDNATKLQGKNWGKSQGVNIEYK